MYKRGPEVESLLAEVAGTYRVIGGPGLEGVDLLLGVRAIETEVDVGVTFPGPLGLAPDITASDTLYDGFIGARYGTTFGSRWALSFHN